MNPPEHDDPRAQARDAWTRATLGDPAAQPVRASMDAGFRSYWRVQVAGGTRIVMDSPPQLEDVRPWLRMHELLRAGGVRVPRVLACDVDAGFLLLEDLGTQTVLHVINDANADACFDAAIGQLLKDIAEDDLRRLLQIDHLNETGRLVVERVIENAAKYHGDKDYRKIVDDILEQQAKESD